MSEIQKIIDQGEFDAICKLALELTRLRQNECKHLCIENAAPEILENLLRAVYESRKPPLITGREMTQAEIEQMNFAVNR